MDDRPLRLVPLGGLGEFGLNAMVLEWEGELLLLDAGMLFPSAEMPGVDSIVPDFAYLAERAGRLRGILLTHGHEDHIGALPYLYEKIRAPIYGSDFTLGLAARKLREHRLPHDRALKRVRAGDEVKLGPFRVQFIQVTHSIPGTFSLAVQTPVGTLIHSADFKMDQTPIDGRTFDPVP